jgi:outer membrane protein assembly factor BamB
VPQSAQVHRIEQGPTIAAVGQIGAAVEVRGLADHEPVFLRLPVTPADAATVDASTARVFRVDTPSGTPAVVEASGLAAGFGHAWALIDAPGVYALVGLPRDKVAQALLIAATSPFPSDATEAAVLLAAGADDPNTLLEWRRRVAADEVAATANPLALTEVRRERGGAVAPPDLPNGITTAGFIARVRSVMAAPEAFAEQRLVVTRVRERADWRAAGIAPMRAGAGPAIPVSANWWMYHRDAQHTGVVTDSHISRANVTTLQPRYRVPLDGPVASVPAVVDNTIYVGIGNSARATAHRGGTLYAIDLVSSAVRATFTFNTPPLGGSRQGLAGIACTPAVMNGRLYFSALDGRLYCLDAATLTPIWVTDLRHADAAHNQPVTHTVAAEGWCSPLVVNGRVYVGCGESESNTFGFVYCLDANTGDVVWLFCTTKFPGVVDNEPNVIPRSVAGIVPLPAPFRVGNDPASRGASPWSSCAYDPVSNRIIVGTGNVLPQGPVPQPAYSLGVLSLDATTGGSPRFFQPSSQDSYRPDDSDCDVPPGPTIYLQGGRRVVAIGSKCGSFFLLDADTLAPLARRQLLPRIGGNGGFPGDTGAPIPAVDPHPPDPETGRRTENFYGIFSTAAVSYGLERLYVGVGGFAFGVGTPGIDSATTAFLRALNWTDLTDAWATAQGPDGVTRYVATTPPMYTTPGEAGFAAPVLVNDLLFMSTSRPGLYAFDAESGVPLWSAPGFGPPRPNSFSLGPVVFGDYVVCTSANLGMLVYSL